MKDEQQRELTEVVKNCLAEAETTWNKVGHELIKKSFYESLSEGSVLSQIPGHPIVEFGKPEVDLFIAMVVDLRGSTKHLTEAISSKKATVSQLQRVFYETSALLPAMAAVISLNSGKVTEYLGDGVLALFRVGENKAKTIYSAYDACKDSLFVVENIVNPILKAKYNLPPLKIGIGLGMSKAVVSLIGLDGYMLPKAFGECVFRATKLSKDGVNQVYIDKAMKLTWPKKKGGILKFEKKKFGDFTGYLLTHK